MKSLDTVRVSKQARDQLISLKRSTGLDQWNVLCRWALCVSLAEKSIPPIMKIVTDSPIEMTWKVFTGGNEGIYRALIIHRCKKDNLEINEETVATQFLLHLHRGIQYLQSDKGIRSVADLLDKAMGEHTSTQTNYENNSATQDGSLT